MRDLGPQLADDSVQAPGPSPRRHLRRVTPRHEPVVDVIAPQPGVLGESHDHHDFGSRIAQPQGPAFQRGEGLNDRVRSAVPREVSVVDQDDFHAVLMPTRAVDAGGTRLRLFALAWRGSPHREAVRY